MNVQIVSLAIIKTRKRCDRFNPRCQVLAMARVTARACNGEIYPGGCVRIGIFQRSTFEV